MRNKDTIKELTFQLGTENKCNFLERQLEYLRNMIRHAGRESTSVLQKQTLRDEGE